jgi:hypothetical protein
MIVSDIKPFKFQVYNRYYDIDFVYGVIALRDVSGKGKTLFVSDLSIAEVPKPYEVQVISPLNLKKSAIERLLNSDTEWFENKIMVVDDTEMMDTELLRKAVYKTVYTNTQWVLVGHGCFVGLRSIGAYRQLQVDQRGDRFYIKLVINDALK